MMIYTLLVYLLLCFLCSWVAGEKNRSAVAWFFISLIFSPLVGFIALIAVPSKSSEQVVTERKQPSRSIGFYGMNY